MKMQKIIIADLDRAFCRLIRKGRWTLPNVIETPRSVPAVINVVSLFNPPHMEANDERKKSSWLVRTLYVRDIEGCEKPSTRRSWAASLTQMKQVGRKSSRTCGPFR